MASCVHCMAWLFFTMRSTSLTLFERLTRREQKKSAQSCCLHQWSLTSPSHCYGMSAGFNARPQNIELVLTAFRDGLKQQGKLKA